MRDFISKNAGGLKPSGIRKFFDIVSEMEDAISLGVGEPDFITPWNVRDEAIRCIRKGYTQYTSNKGLIKLRELISRYLKERFSVEYPADETVITVGASEAIDITLRAVLEPGDEVIIPEPCYVSYTPIVKLTGGTPVVLPCTMDNGFKITPEMLDKVCTKRTKVLLLSYPNNPTGGIMEKEYLEALIPIIEKHDLLVISDEIYAELTYGGGHCSIASFPGMKERTVLINGFSKAYAMTGWRIGYVCAPKEICGAILKIHQYVIMCAPTFSQYAAIAALEDGFKDGFQTVLEMHGEYDRRRRFMVGAFNEMGLDCFEPKGAFYVFPSVKSTGLSGEDFANSLLREERVAVVPGGAFGESGKDHIRCSYAYSMENLAKAVDKIESFVKKLR